jgi:hypothetical protein
MGNCKTTQWRMDLLHAGGTQMLSFLIMSYYKYPLDVCVHKLVSTYSQLNSAELDLFVIQHEMYDCDSHHIHMNENTLTTCTAPVQESKFWKFLLKDVSVAAWSYVVWILLRKCIFAGIMTLTMGSVNALANVVLHFADASVILLMR